MSGDLTGLCLYIRHMSVSIYTEGYGITLEPYNENLPTPGHSLRPQPHRIFKDSSRLVLAESSFNVDSAKLWNGAPYSVTSAATLNLAKKNIRIYVESLPY